MNLPISDPRLLRLLEIEDLTAEQTEELIAALEANPEASQELDEFLGEMRQLNAEVDIPMPSAEQWNGVFDKVLTEVAEPVAEQPSADESNPDAPVAEDVTTQENDADSQAPTDSSANESPNSDLANQSPVDFERGAGVSIVASIVILVLFLISLPSTDFGVKVKDDSGSKTKAETNNSAQSDKKNETLNRQGPKETGIDPTDFDPNTLTSNEEFPETDVIVEIESGSSFVCYPRSHLGDDNSAMTVIWVAKADDEDQ